LKFPGSKLLHHWDLSVQRPPELDDLFRSSQTAGLTGFIEVKFQHSVGMIFYYLGGEVNALYREGAIAHNGQAALEKLRAQSPPGEGTIAVYELPLDVAHLLRGITNRQRLKEPLTGRSGLTDVLKGLEKSEHTGTLEIQGTDGSTAMVLLVRGRVSNTYFESPDGLTLEKKEAMNRLEESLRTRDTEVQAFVSDFSRDVWKTRHEVQDGVRSRLERREEHPPASEQLAEEESALRSEALEELCAALPSVTQTFLFDLITGRVLTRRGGKGSSMLRVDLLAERIPSLSSYLRDLVAAEERDEVEVFELTTGRLSLVVAMVPQTLEAIAAVADRAQPTALIEATMMRIVRAYASRAAGRLGAA
jgi:hypothetical protein